MPEIMNVYRFKGTSHGKSGQSSVLATASAAGASTALRRSGTTPCKRSQSAAAKSGSSDLRTSPCCAAASMRPR